MLILDADFQDESAHGQYRVTQRVSPRVMIVEPAVDVTKEHLQATDGIATVLEPGESADAATRQALTATEALFVDAYAQRFRHKERPGDGVSWDAPGFLPPDSPTKE